MYVIVLCFYCALIVLSFRPQKPEPVTTSNLQRKRLSSEGATPAKRNHSPIRFDPKPGDNKTSSTTEKRSTMSYYTPPRDQFSKKVSANGDEFESYRSQRGGRGFRGGRGGYGKRRGQRGGQRW